MVLEISILGPLEVRLDSERVNRFKSVKVRALLAYLAAEAGRPHARPTLAGLLWPDWPEAAATKNLRQTLYYLRKMLKENKLSNACILADRSTITFEPGESCAVDALFLNRSLAAIAANPTSDNDMELLEQAVSQVRGDFLEGLFLDDCPEFEAWILKRREYYHQQLTRAHGILSTWYESQGKYKEAEYYARKQLNLVPWRESSHRQVIRMLMLNGKKSEALAQFEECKRVLKSEFETEPDKETLDLIEQIRTGNFNLPTGRNISKQLNPDLPGNSENKYRRNLPTGTVTFLFTDIEGSTPHWEKHPELMEESLKQHNDILFEAILSNEGKVIKLVGDEFQVAFTTAPQALQAAIDIQVGLKNANWNELGPLKVCIGLNTGEAHLDDIGDEYAVSPTKNRVGRIRSAAHGGQVLLSRESADLCETTLPDEVSLKYLGEFSMKGLTRLEPIYQAVVPGLQEDFPPLATLTAPKNNLPLELTSFIGREQEIEAVTALLAENRLVTLTGIGGTGKTRLAIRTAEGVLDDYPNGVWFVELASLSDPELVPRTIVNVLGLLESAQQKPLDQLKAFLRDKQTLIVLDNCEHVIADCARISHELLLACPNVKIMASSREALGVAGEAAYSVPSLPIPDTDILENLTQNPAVRLFTERAKAVKADFNIESDNASAVVQVCKRLDGIPLAIELAAARIGAFSPAQIVEHLDDRFRLLTGGSRTAVPRLQTLRASIDWSYSLLVESERLLLIRLSVFQGGWTLEMAQKVCAFDGLDEFDVLEGMAQLVNKSLIFTVSTMDGVNRYHRLETIRQYAREKLMESGGSEVLYDRHLDAFLDMAEEAKPHLRRRRHLEWLDRLELELDNIRVALTWALEQDAVKGLQIATSIYWFWHCRSYKIEGESWMQQLQEQVKKSGIDVNPALLSDVLARRAMLLFSGFVGSSKSYQMSEEALQLAEGLGEDHKRVKAVALLSMSWNFISPKDSLKFGKQCLAIAEEIGDDFLISEAVHLMSRYETDQVRVKACLDRQLELVKRLGDEDGLMAVEGYYGNYYMWSGEFTRAIQWYEQSIQRAITLRNYPWLIGSYAALGRAFNLLGNPDKAIESIHQGLESAKALGGDQVMIIRSYMDLGYVYASKRDWSQAEEYCLRAIETARMLQLTNWEANACFALAHVAWSIDKVDIAVQYFRKAADLHRGRNIRFYDRMSAYSFGMVSLLLEDLASSIDSFLAALKGFSEGGNMEEVAQCLEALALSTIHENLFDNAVRLRGTAINCRGWRKFSAGWSFILCWSFILSGKVENAFKPVRAALGESRYDELLQEGQAVPVEDVVAYVEEVLGE